jgi:hypothetical protein
VIQH